MQYAIQVKHLSVEGGFFWLNSTVLKRRWKTSERNGREEKRGRDDDEGCRRKFLRVEESPGIELLMD